MSEKVDVMHKLERVVNNLLLLELQHMKMKPLIGTIWNITVF